MECMDVSEKRRSADSRWLEMTGITVFLISSWSASGMLPPPMKLSSRQDSRLYQGLWL